MSKRKKTFDRVMMPIYIRCNTKKTHAPQLYFYKATLCEGTFHWDLSFLYINDIWYLLQNEFWLCQQMMTQAESGFD